MRRLSSRITYSNVVATLALFVALAGGTALAAKSMLPKNSVGTKQIKNNAVTGAKIADGTITGAKIQASSLGTVPSATSAAHASSADNAGRAGTADTASIASNANSLGGVPASSYATTKLEPEHLLGTPGEPALEHGCVVTGPPVSPAGYYKDPFGVVHLRGFLASCTSAASAFVLPAGFRPTAIEIQVDGTGNSESGLVRIDPDGTVSLFGGTNAILNGVEFRTD